MMKGLNKPLLSINSMLTVSLIALVVIGCATSPQGTAPQHEKAGIGGVGGAAAGGLLAAVFRGGPAGVVGGALLGGLIGSAIGDRMDAADRREAQNAAQRAFEKAPSGTAVTWRNPDSGHSGEVIPVRTYQRSGGRYCREYKQVVNIGGQMHQAYGTACRQPDGSWKIVK